MKRHPRGNSLNEFFLMLSNDYAMFRAVFQLLHRVIALLVLAGLVSGFASCSFACVSDADHQDDAQAECHCTTHCSCHTLSMPANGNEEALKNFQPNRFAPEPFRVKLPQFAASIFNPPRA